MNQNVKNVDQYISRAKIETQKKLIQLRKIILEAAPSAEERISYQMPAYFQNGILVYFGAFKDHVSLFPTGSSVVDQFEETKKYKTSKGTLQFPLDKRLPVDLIKKIVVARVKENETKKAGYGK